jgi:hypothetical protein
VTQAPCLRVTLRAVVASLILAGCGPSEESDRQPWSCGEGPALRVRRDTRGPALLFETFAWTRGSAWFEVEPDCSWTSWNGEDLYPDFASSTVSYVRSGVMENAELDDLLDRIQVDRWFAGEAPEHTDTFDGGTLTIVLDGTTHTCRNCAEWAEDVQNATSRIGYDLQSRGRPMSDLAFRIVTFDQGDYPFWRVPWGASDPPSTYLLRDDDGDLSGKAPSDADLAWFRQLRADFLARDPDDPTWDRQPLPGVEADDGVWTVAFKDDFPPR